MLRFPLKPLLASLVLLVGCNSLPIDTSAFALASGQSTIVLGGCNKPLEVGWSACNHTRGSPLPRLRLFFTNAASYAVGDCNANVWRTGSVPSAQMVEIDLSELRPDAEARGFCLLKIEAEETYNDGRVIPLAGGFFIETLAPGYLPTPTRPEIAWCYKVGRTTAGRTIMEACRD